MRKLWVAIFAVACCGCTVTVPVAIIGRDGHVLRGTAITGSSSGSFTVSDGAATCRWGYGSRDRSLTVSMPVTCSDGRSGTVTATRDANVPSGAGTFTLSDGSRGTFLFGPAAAGF
jgi:hypothetical protein